MNRQRHYPRYWVVISAAGLGLRMGADKPKQYLKIHQKTILEHTLDIFLSHPKISKLVVVLHPRDHYWREIPLSNSSQIITAIGGDTRAQSVLQGLKALANDAAPNDWVLVHDSVRPCLTKKILDRLLNQLSNHPVGGILGIPVRDTLKQINDEGAIIQTLSREQAWCAQTPQMFRYQLLLDALTQTINQRQIVTDDAGAIEKLGYKPQMIMGDIHNIKITYPDDLIMSEKFLYAEEVEPCE